MNIIFLRYGQATDNKKNLISDKEIYWLVLTNNGINSIKELPNKIDIAYVSPLPRTIETAHIVYNKYPNLEFIIDDRIKEIQYGKYLGKSNNIELYNIRKKQINGDHFTRFGDYGEKNLI